MANIPDDSIASVIECNFKLQPSIHCMPEFLLLLIITQEDSEMYHHAPTLFCI